MDNLIPLLEVVQDDYRKLFMSNIDEDDFFENVSRKYSNAILDIFESSLEEDSEELKYLESTYFRLRNEDKYLHFLEEVFVENKEECYINIDFSTVDYTFLLEQLNKMDLVDKYIYIHQEREFENKNNKNYLIKDINLLKMFIRGILRETLRVDLYFPYKPLLVFSNFDLSLPLVFKKEEDKHYYQKIVKKYNLYFR